MKSCLSNILIVAIFSAICIGIAYYFYSAEKPLPILQPRHVRPELVDQTMLEVSDHRVAFFTLADQTGGLTDSSFTAGRIHVADFFFTTCQTICPIMTGKMDRVARHFDGNENLRFLSFSVLPEEDSVAVLRDYAQAYGARPSQWRFLTGDKKDIYELARRSYFTLKPAEAGSGDGGNSDFIHTNNFVLVDTKQRIRGYYDGTSDLEIERLIDNIEQLLGE